MTATPPAPGLKLLLIGGTGVISSAVVPAALALGHEVTVLRRGTTSDRSLPDDVETLVGDIRDPASLRGVLGNRRFDVVVDFVAFTPDHVRTDIDLFAGRTDQYVFISSAATYEKPVLRLPIVESMPLRNPFWEYARDKAAAEDVLVQAHRDGGFPVTIVRPSHTYDRTLVPLTGGWTAIDRMRRGEPIVVHGDGTSLWTLTHHTDFAKIFVGLLGNQQAVGDVFHITSDEALTWDQIAAALARAAGVEPRIVHVASDTIAAHAPEWGPGILGDKAHSLVFDNSKVHALAPRVTADIPFAAGAREMLAWFDADESRRVVDADADRRFDELVAWAARR